LRSTLVRESCVVLALLAEKLKEAFDSSAAFYIPFLLKQVSVKIKVISESADQCVRALLRNTKTTSIKPILNGGRYYLTLL
jgi:hypothetical protein